MDFPRTCGHHGFSTTDAGRSTKAWEEPPMKQRLIAVLTAAALFVAVMAGSAIALHPGLGVPNEPVIGPHQHYINGQRVGPNACEDGPSLAFDHFHMNVHVGMPGHGRLHMVTATGC